MGCLGCGAEIAEEAQVCGQCGASAPVEYQLFVAEDRAAGATYDAADGPAPAAILTDVEQQRPESGPDPEADRAELAEWVQTQKFSTTRLRPGYDEDEVDAFLDEAEVRLATQTGVPVLPARQPSAAADPAATQPGGRGGPSPLLLGSIAGLAAAGVVIGLTRWWKRRGNL
jgi:DivIVA domain-containing protein